MKFCVVILSFALIAFPALAARVDVPSLPPSPYADTEAVTNVAFGTGVAGDNVFALSLALDASPSNNVEAAFGCDADENGILDDSEVAFAVGWDCGEWFFRDVVADVADSCIGSCGHVSLDWRLRLDSSLVPKDIRAHAGGMTIPFPVMETMYDQAWNMARVLCGPGHLLCRRRSLRARVFRSSVSRFHAQRRIGAENSRLFPQKWANGSIHDFRTSKFPNFPLLRITRGLWYNNYHIRRR